MADHQSRVFGLGGVGAGLGGQFSVLQPLRPPVVAAIPWWVWVGGTWLAEKIASDVWDDDSQAHCFCDILIVADGTHNGKAARLNLNHRIRTTITCREDAFPGGGAAPDGPCEDACKSAVAAMQADCDAYNSAVANGTAVTPNFGTSLENAPGGRYQTENVTRTILNPAGNRFPDTTQSHFYPGMNPNFPWGNYKNYRVARMTFECA